MSYFLVRVGEGSRYADEALREGFIAIGWDKVPDLDSLGTIEAIKNELARSYDYSSSQLNVQASQLARFAFGIKPDDIIITPQGRGVYSFGRVGAYYLEPNPKGSCPYVHRRRMVWDFQRISKDEMSTQLKYAVGVPLLFFPWMTTVMSWTSWLKANQSSHQARNPARSKTLCSKDCCSSMERNSKVSSAIFLEFSDFLQPLHRIRTTKV